MFWESLPDAISTNFNTHSLVTVFESFRLSHYLYDFVTISMMFARAYFDYCTFYHTHNPERQTSARLIAVPRGLNPCHEFSVSGTSSQIPNGHVIRSVRQIQGRFHSITSVKIMMHRRRRLNRRDLGNNSG